jgi:hypothetical protein
MDLFLRNPRYMGLKFPDMSRPETLQKKYVGKVGKREMDFMKSVLQMKPKNRMNAKAGLEHPYFEAIRPKVTEETPLVQQEHIQEIPSFYNKSDRNESRAGDRNNGPNNGPSRGSSNAPTPSREAAASAAAAQAAQQKQQKQKQLQIQMQMQQLAPPKEDGRDSLAGGGSAGYDQTGANGGNGANSRVLSQQNVPLHEEFESKPTASARDARGPLAGFTRYSEAKPIGGGSRGGGGGGSSSSNSGGGSSNSGGGSRNPATLQAFNSFHAAPPSNDDHSRFNKFDRTRGGAPSQGSTAPQGSTALPKDDPFLMGGQSGAQTGMNSFVAKRSEGGKRESKRERRAEEKERAPKAGTGARRQQNRSDLALSEPKSMVKEAFFEFKGGRTQGGGGGGIGGISSHGAGKQRSGEGMRNGIGSSQGTRKHKKKAAAPKAQPQQRGQFAWRPLPSFLETGNKPSNSGKSSNNDTTMLVLSCESRELYFTSRESCNFTK